MKLNIPQELKNLAQNCPFKLYLVGGYCRDALIGFKNNFDYDICAPTSPEQLKAVAEGLNFTVRAVYSHTGTVKLVGKEGEYEFASFRTDSYIRGHAPESVDFTDDIYLDALRRDFKCNAVYYDICAEQFVDPLGGMEDIREKRMDCVRDSERVFGEDGLRLMRLCRQCAQIGFTPSDMCLRGAKANAELILDISLERIWAELNAILQADSKNGIKGAQYYGLKLLHATGVLKYILPELALGEGMEQRNDFHSHDVLEHSLRCVLYADERIRLAALLHDIGKPRCKIDTGLYRNHENVGAVIADKICRRLRISTALREKTCRLIALHMYDLRGDAKESKIKKIILSNGDIWQELLLLKQADYSACRDDLSLAPCVDKWQGIYNKMLLNRAPLSLRELSIRGNDLIELGISADKVGKILNTLLFECAICDYPNVKEKLINRSIKLSEEK